jgi:hypothetical protein
LRPFSGNKAQKREKMMNSKGVMMTEKTRVHRLIGLFVLLCAAVPYVFYTDAARAEQTAIDAVVVKGSEPGGPYGRSVLLTDREEIHRHAELFLDNPRTVWHACGSHYELQFWSGMELVESFFYNIECGEEYERNTDAIAALMQDYDRRFRAGTVDTLHYLYIPVDRDPQTLIQDMRRDGWHVFPVGGLTARYPFITLEFTFEVGGDSRAFEEDAQTKALALLEHWPENVPRPIEYTPPEQVGSMISPRLRTRTFRSVVRFPLEANLEKIAAALASETVKAAGTRPEHYLLALICPKENRGKLKEQLKNYPITGIW